MSPIAPIGAVRVAAIRPVQPGPMDDPFEDGLAVEVVTEPTMVPVTDQVTAVSDANEAQLDLSQGSYAASVTPLATEMSFADPARVPNHASRGNAAVTTGFDSRPASNLGDAPRGNFASPFARAMCAYSGG